MSASHLKLCVTTTKRKALLNASHALSLRDDILVQCHQRDDIMEKTSSLPVGVIKKEFKLSP